MALFVPLVWALGFTGAKAAMGQFPPILLMAFRFMIAALVMVWFVRPPWPLMRRIFVITVISATVPYSTIFTGLSHLDVSTAMLVVQAQVPLMFLIAVVALGEKMTWKKFVGIVIAFGGIVMIAGQPQLRSGLGWIFVVIAGGAVWATGQVMIRLIGPLIDGQTLIAWVSVFTVPQLLVSSAIFESGQWDAIVSADWRSWALILYMGLVMTAAGYTVWYSLLARVEVTLAAPFLLLQPVVAVTAAILFLNEEPSWITLIGGVVVIAGIAIITVDRPRRKCIPLAGTEPAVHP